MRKVRGPGRAADSRDQLVEMIVGVSSERPSAQRRRRLVDTQANRHDAIMDNRRREKQEAANPSHAPKSGRSAEVWT
jgi:hypothetical protein